jgi:hypothetical protein
VGTEGHRHQQSAGTAGWGLKVTTTRRLNRLKKTAGLELIVTTNRRKTGWELNVSADQRNNRAQGPGANVPTEETAGRDRLESKIQAVSGRTGVAGWPVSRGGRAWPDGQGPVSTGRRAWPDGQGPVSGQTGVVD